MLVVLEKGFQDEYINDASFPMNFELVFERLEVLLLYVVQFKIVTMITVRPILPFVLECDQLEICQVTDFMPSNVLTCTVQNDVFTDCLLFDHLAVQSEVVSNVRLYVGLLF